nr:hypothetical protein [Tanacetum cinerariifolium]
LDLPKQILEAQIEALKPENLENEDVGGIGEVGYGIRDTWVDPTGTVPEIAPMTVGEMQQAEIVELRETNHRRQAQMVETLRVMGDIRREMGDMRAELLALREQPRRARQLGGDARVPNH